MTPADVSVIFAKTDYLKNVKPDLMKTLQQLVLLKNRSLLKKRTVVVLHLCKFLLSRAPDTVFETNLTFGKTKLLQASPQGQVGPICEVENVGPKGV